MCKADAIQSALAVLLVTCCACSPRNDVEAADKAVDTFRADIATGRFDRIYHDADNDFRSTASLPEFEQYERIVQTTLGAFQSAELTNYNVIYVWGGSEVRFDYRSRFSKAAASETFTIKVKQHKAVISGYRIDSPLLPKAH